MQSVSQLSVTLGLLWGCCLGFPNPACFALEPLAEVVGTPTVKGVVLCRLTFPHAGEVRDVAVAYSRDGVQFEEARIGLPRPWKLFRTIRDDGETTNIFVPAVGRFHSIGGGSFLLDAPGNHYLTWSIGFQDKTIPRVRIQQVIRASDARQADLDFLLKLAEPAVVRRLVGDEEFERASNALRERSDETDATDFWSLTILREVFLGTRERTPVDTIASHEDAESRRIWGETLLMLARHFPDSSYAPYAAYYAGFCHAAVGLNRCIDAVKAELGPELRKDMPLRQRKVIELVRTDKDCREAVSAFEFALEEGDAYLKPRAAYQLATMRSFAGRFDDAEKLLTTVERLASGDKMLLEWAGDVLEGIRRAKAIEEKGSD